MIFWSSQLHVQQPIVINNYNIISVYAYMRYKALFFIIAITSCKQIYMVKKIWKLKWSMHA